VGCALVKITQWDGIAEVVRSRRLNWVVYLIRSSPGPVVCLLDIDLFVCWFCWKSLMPLGMLALLRVVSLLLYRSEKGFGYALRIDTSAERKVELPEAIWERERVGCMWAMIRGILYDLCFSFVSTSLRKRTDMCHDRWKDGRRTSLCPYIYSCP